MTVSSDEQTTDSPAEIVTAPVSTRSGAKLIVAFVTGALLAVLAIIAIEQLKAPATQPVPRAAARHLTQATTAPNVTASPDARQWPVFSIGSSKATLWTKPGEGVLMVRLVVDALPEGGLDFSDDASMVIKLLDADGFAIAEHRLRAGESIRHRTPQGRLESYEWLDSADVSPEIYERVSQWKLSWSGIGEFVGPSETPVGLVVPLEELAPHSTAPGAPGANPTASAAASPVVLPVLAPEPENPPLWKDAVRWKRLKAGNSQPQVILALGVPSKKTSSAAMETWYYGEVGVGGFVFFERQKDGYRVKSFSAPQD